MAFKVKHDVWLQNEADRVQGIIFMPKYWHRAWTPQSLKKELADPIGLHYSMSEILKINDELHRRGDVEDIPGD